MRTITVKLEMLSLKPDEMYNVSKYPEDGLYIVDDGITHLIASVFDGSVAAIPIPSRQVIDEYVRAVKDVCAQSQDDMTKRDIEARRKLANEIDKLDTTMGHVLDTINKLGADLSSVPQSNIDLAGLTKMIAVAQKPDLVKGR